MKNDTISHDGEKIFRNGEELSIEEIYHELVRLEMIREKMEMII